MGAGTEGISSVNSRTSAIALWSLKRILIPIPVESIRFLVFSECFSAFFMSVVRLRFR